MDYTAEPLCAWFNNEQIEGVEHLEGGRQSRNGRRRPSGLLMLDREMGARVFLPGSPFDPLAYNGTLTEAGSTGRATAQAG
jgi:hypothetical protein